MKSLLCVLSEEQAKQFENSCLGQASRDGVRVTIEPSPDDALEVVGRQKPDLMIVGMTVGGMEGLEFLAMLMARYPDLAAKVVMLPETGDPFPPMIHFRDPQTGRSMGEESNLEAVAALIRELAPKRPEAEEVRPPKPPEPQPPRAEAEPPKQAPPPH